MPPVSDAPAADVNPRATAILQEAQTGLLRSADTADKRAQYARIADAIGSNKVLLRA